MNTYKCPLCGKTYYSAAELEHLVNKCCECGGELKDKEE